MVSRLFVLVVIPTLFSCFSFHLPRIDVDSKKAIKIEWTLPLYENLPVNRLYVNKEQSMPLLVDNRIVQATNLGDVYLIDPTARSHSVLIDKDDSFLASPSIARLDGRDILLIGDVNGHFIAYDFGQKKTRWSFRANSAIVTPAAVWENLVIISDTRNTLYALSLNDGKIVWQKKRDYSGSRTLLGTAPPVVFGEEIFVGYADNTIVCYRSESGEKKWERQLEKKGGNINGIIVEPLLSRQRIYISAYASPLYALSTDQGVINWEMDDFEGTSHGIGQDDQTLYLGDSNGNLFAIAKSDGTLAWKQSREAFTRNVGELPSKPYLVGSHLLVGYSQSDVFLVDKTNGMIEARLAIGGGLNGSFVADQAGKIYFFSNFGILYCISIVS